MNHFAEADLHHAEWPTFGAKTYRDEEVKKTPRIAAHSRNALYPFRRWFTQTLSKQNFLDKPRMNIEQGSTCN